MSKSIKRLIIRGNKDLVIKALNSLEENKESLKSGMRSIRFTDLSKPKNISNENTKTNKKERKRNNIWYINTKRNGQFEIKIDKEHFKEDTLLYIKPSKLAQNKIWVFERLIIKLVSLMLTLTALLMNIVTFVFNKTLIYWQVISFLIILAIMCLVMVVHYFTSQSENIDEITDMVEDIVIKKLNIIEREGE